MSSLQVVRTGSGYWQMRRWRYLARSGFRSTGAYEDDCMMDDYETAASTNQIFHLRTHLGGNLQPSGAVTGYHLSNCNINSDDFASLPQDRIPDVILVKEGVPKPP
jgi:nonsense-mediated mRNA decay protein 3